MNIELTAKEMRLLQESILTRISTIERFMENFTVETDSELVEYYNNDIGGLRLLLNLIGFNKQ
jgi:hypothetical protein